MNTENLMHLLALSETGSFSEAAARDGVSQPAVSLAVKKMENDFGVKLFKRSGNRYVPTAVGQVFLEHAREVVDAERRLLSSIEQASGTLAGKLRISTSNIPGEYVLPLILGDFRKTHPDIEPMLEVLDSSRVIDSIRAGTFDLGFIGSSDPPRDVESVRFCPDRLMVICAPSNPLAQKRSVKPERLADEKFVLREEGSATRNLMETSLAEVGLDVSALKVEMELGSTSAVMSAVEAGSGISMASIWAAKGPLSEGRIKSINVPSLKTERQFSLVYRKGDELPSPAGAFKEFVLSRRAFLKKHMTQLKA